MENSRSKKTVIAAECAVMVAVATVLGFIKIWTLPYGGSVTLFSMAPLILLSFRRGARVGVFASFVYSVLQLVIGISDVSYLPTAWGVIACIFLDYISAYTVIGLAGIFGKIGFSENAEKNKVISSVVGTAAVVTLRFLCHLVSGAVIWYSLTKGWDTDPGSIVNRYGAWVYSAIYNASFMLPEMVITVVVAPFLVRATRKIGI